MLKTLNKSLYKHYTRFSKTWKNSGYLSQFFVLLYDRVPS